jgi:hypothetical protein
MFGMAPVVEAVDLRQNMLIFRSGQSFQRGQKVRVRIHIPPGSGRVMPVDVEIVDERCQGKAGKLYRTRVLSDLGGAEFRGSDPALRDKERHSTNVRVRSRDLPGFRAMAVDLSHTGVQLEVEAPMEIGKTLQLHMDLDGFRYAQVVCPARTVWCRPCKETGKLRAGLQFLPPSPPVDKQLRELAEFLEARSESQLEELLDQAKILTPDVEPASQPLVKAAPAPPRAAAERRHALRTLTLPLDAKLDGYARNLNAGSLFVNLAGADGVLQTLEFPDCRLVHDHLSSVITDVRGLGSTQDSDLLLGLKSRLGEGNWKHYQLLGPSQEVVLEIVSRQCRPAGAR